MPKIVLQHILRRSTPNARGAITLGGDRAWKSASDAGNISPMEQYLLVVTLVLGQQPPHSYKLDFSSKETCEQAASDLRLNYNKTFRNVTGVMTVCAKK
jgi:hypothetical protein